ncbi:hypothetical protein [Methanobrevibacter sp. UBA212]|uniref:hypothetical protein n=1 Tax=Methanobrevibacter sp. UBA212 TaxID=1915476 RepID=UPI0025DA74E8|nr:hypothetical protein [Methanobrevibacter sp. UBA212]
MTSFDFLKSFNRDLYEIGVKLEEDALNSPRAVTADATLFLENLVKDIYRISNKKLEKHLKSFYKKVDNLYRSGVISYIYKNKLQEAYNLRNKIHKESLESSEEKKLAFDLHKRLYYISKKYFRDFCENEAYISIPDYKKPTQIDIHFENCIICGNSNKKSMSNMCKICNQKIENANFMLSIQNTFNDSPFTRQDLIEFGINESRAILLLMDLSRFDAVTNDGEYYTIHRENFNEYLHEIDQYIEIGILITRFYRNEISAAEIKKTPEYIKGCKDQLPYREFFKLATAKIEKSFEDELLQSKDIKRSMRKSSMNELDVKYWFHREKESFNNGTINDAFILYNKILIDDFFKMKRKGHEDDEDILIRLHIPKDIYCFWKTHFIAGKFTKKNKNFKRDLIISELKNNRTLNEALKSAKVTKEDFEKMYRISQDANDEFYQDFNREYIEKRQKSILRHLQNHNLNRAIRLSKITKTEFLKWYYESEKGLSDFYVKTTELLMEKYIEYRKNDWNKREILKKINISKDMYNSWSKHEELYRQFESMNAKITSDLIKRGRIINGIREGKSKQEAIFYANLTPREFVEIYNTSKREKTEFYLRFDVEYEKSRKKLFIEIIKQEDFYNAIQKCEISQREFNEWYFKDQDRFISTRKASLFYLNTTFELMDKYIKTRISGKNKPEAAKSVGLSNMTINKWLNHPEFDIFDEFAKRIRHITINLVVDGFNQGKSKIEVAELCDISIKTIDEFIELGQNGFKKYEELFYLYENRVIPKHLDIFLNDFQTKSLFKSLKHAKLSKEELDHYYDLGKEGNEQFKDFYHDFFDVKINLLVDNILSKKSLKISLKNSYLSREEFEENKEYIEDIILMERIILIADGINKNKTTGVKLAKSVGISVDEIYEWYVCGKDGEERFRIFSQIFELGVVLPRVLAFKKARDIGIPVKFLNKKLKKDLGSADYRNWQEHDIINQRLEFTENDGESIDEKKVKNFLEKSELFTLKDRKIKSKDLKNLKEFLNDKSMPVVEISLVDNADLENNEAMGK